MRVRIAESVRKRVWSTPVRVLIRELVETVILALLIFLALQFSIENVQVEGSSMEPTLEQGQYLLVNKMVYASFTFGGLKDLLPFIDGEPGEQLFPFHPPRRGEVIVFHYPLDPTRDFVKRVIGIPGDVVEIDTGVVSVNETRLDEPYVTHPDRKSMVRTVVPPDTYFVLGDNRRASNDSRAWGPVPTDLVIGRGWLSYWPLNRWHTLGIFGMP
jgi:signal peptidase I